MKRWKTRAFDRWAKKEGVSDDDLLCAADEVADGRFEGDLGGSIIKKRVARPGGGKRGGFRTIVAFRSRSSSRIIFLHGFAKNKKSDLSAKEKTALQTNAGVLLSLSWKQLRELERDGDLIAVRRAR